MSGKAVRETVGFLGVIASMVFNPDNLRLRELWPQLEGVMSPDFASYIERELGLTP